MYAEARKVPPLGQSSLTRLTGAVTWTAGVWPLGNEIARARGKGCRSIMLANGWNVCGHVYIKNAATYQS